MTSKEYTAARRALLNALEALEAQLDALVLVGAQAVYLLTGSAGSAIAPTTTDADLAIDATLLSDDPRIGEALVDAGFELLVIPGTWSWTDGVRVDLMVAAEQMSNTGGRRGARLGVHGNKAARKTAGLEPALIDNDPVEIRSFEPEADPRVFTIRAAGPTALLIAKLTKIRERAATADRLQPKDGLDVFRLLQTSEPEMLADMLRKLVDHVLTAGVTRAAVEFLRTDPEEVLIRLAIAATAGVEDPEIVAESMRALVEDLLESLGTLD
ncbi:hypothetical protein [Glycomyces sp. NRRL B-16210]|uniref:hypothetical protein n=1 Tax=Glycomyces sp. NRRL B-16210 TaxID=1463821 RepID=UPI00068AAFE3|nr:hypothetical protein [Glycomyces sp. NRRL B-16210]